MLWPCRPAIFVFLILKGDRFGVEVDFNIIAVLLLGVVDQVLKLCGQDRGKVSVGRCRGC